MFKESILWIFAWPSNNGVLFWGVLCGLFWVCILWWRIRSPTDLRDTANKRQELGIDIETRTCPERIWWQHYAGWWLNQPIWRICSSNWVNIFPNFRDEHKKYVKPPPTMDLIAFCLGFLPHYGNIKGEKSLIFPEWFPKSQGFQLNPLPLKRKHLQYYGGTNRDLLMVSTHLKNISQIGTFPQIGVKIKDIWNQHLEYYGGTNKELLHLLILGGKYIWDSCGNRIMKTKALTYWNFEKMKQTKASKNN